MALSVGQSLADGNLRETNERTVQWRTDARFGQITLINNAFISMSLFLSRPPIVVIISSLKLYNFIARIRNVFTSCRERTRRFIYTLAGIFYF